MNEFGPNSAPVGDLADDLARHFRGLSNVEARSVWITGHYDPGGMKPERLRNAFLLFIFMPFYFGFLKMRALSRRCKAVVVVVTTPPLLHWLCSALGRLWQVRVIIWYQDAHPYLSMKGLEKRGLTWLAGVLGIIDRWALRAASGFIALDQSMRQHLIKRGVDSERIKVASPWITYLHPAQPMRLPKSLPVKVIYAGNFGRAHDLGPLMRILAACSPKQQRQFEFHFLGMSAGSEPEIRTAFAGLAVEPVFHKRLPSKKQVLAFFQNFDLGIVSLRDDFWGFACPSKAFSYLSQGLPILYIGSSGTLADELVERGMGVRACREFAEDPLEYMRTQLLWQSAGVLFEDPKPASQAVITDLVFQ